jgi:polysaccharide export outer membrane protein
MSTRRAPLPRAPRTTALAAPILALAVACGGPHGSFTPVEHLGEDAGASEYRISPGDVISVRVFNQDSMSSLHTRVRDDGKVSIPFLQDVDVAGSTPNELSQRLQVKLKAYVVNPVVTVTVDEFRPLRVSVVGEVARPGQYELERGAGVLAALAAAGGLTDYAHRDALFVLRTGADGKAQRIRFRYASLIEGEKPAAIFHLRAGDVVVAE